MKPVALVANVAPWLAPLPTAWWVYEGALNHLGAPGPVAIGTGIIIEVFGVGVMHTTLTLWSYNREKRKSDPAAPAWIGWALVGVYFVTAELLTAFLKTMDGTLAAWAPAVFPVLSIAAMAVLALRADHERRIASVAQSKQQARADRLRRRNETKTVVQSVQEPEPDAPPWFRTKSDHVRWLASSNGHMTMKEIAQEVGCAPSTVSRALKGKGE